jgi:hypothetical protein
MRHSSLECNDVNQHLEVYASGGYSELGKQYAIKGSCNQIPFTNFKDFGQGWFKT